MATTQLHPTEESCPRCLTQPRTTPEGSHCPQCGLVLEESPIDHSPPWNNYQEDTENPSHAAPGNPNSSRRLGTQTPNLENNRARSLQRQLNSGSQKERSRNNGTSEVHRVGVNTGLPTPLVERAKYLYRQLHSGDYLKGHDIDTVSAGCVWVACREPQSGRTASDIQETARCGERDLTREGRRIASELGVLLPPPDPLARTRVIAGRLGIVGEGLREALGLVRDYTGGSAPSSVACAALYEVSAFTQDRVADRGGVSCVALRDAWNELGT